MPCTPVKLRDERGHVTPAIVCTARPRRRFCAECKKHGRRTDAPLLCDGTANGKRCDAPICRSHARSLGPDVDLCVSCVLAGSTPFVPHKNEPPATGITGGSATSDRSEMACP